MSNATGPDKAVGYVATLTLLPIATGLVPTWLAGGDPFAGGAARFAAWLIPTFVAIAILVIIPGGFLHPNRYGPSRIGKLAATIALAVFVAVGFFSTTHDWPLIGSIASSACLWLAGILLTWNTLASRRSFGDIAGGALLLLTSAVPLPFIMNYQRTLGTDIAVAVGLGAGSGFCFGLALLRGGRKLTVTAAILLLGSVIAWSYGGLRIWLEATKSMESLHARAGTTAPSQLFAAIFFSSGWILLIVGLGYCLSRLSQRPGVSLAAALDWVALIIFGVASLLCGIGLYFVARMYPQASTPIMLLGPIFLAPFGSALLMSGIDERLSRRRPLELLAYLALCASMLSLSFTLFSQGQTLAGIACALGFAGLSLDKLINLLRPGKHSEPLSTRVRRYWLSTPSPNTTESIEPRRAGGQLDQLGSHRSRRSRAEQPHDPDNEAS